MKITVDKEKCVGGGQCVLAASNIFDQDDATGIVILLHEAPSIDSENAVREAAFRCPAAAIHIIE
jgi:ferredoxin